MKGLIEFDGYMTTSDIFYRNFGWEKFCTIVLVYLILFSRKYFPLLFVKAIRHPFYLSR